MRPMCAGDTLSRCRKDIFAEPSSDMLLLPWHDTISGAGCDGFFYLLFHSFLYLPFHLFIFAVSFSIISVSFFHTYCFYICGALIRYAAAAMA